MTTEIDIMELERKFWQAMVDMDLDAATSLLDVESVSVSSWGIHRFDPEGYRQSAMSGGARITFFTFSDEKVVFPTPGVAIASYKAKQSFTLNGESHDMTVYDTTTWVRKGDRWVASCHTESPEQKAA